MLYTFLIMSAVLIIATVWLLVDEYSKPSEH